jgi:SAM-dependent methyltransferase
MKKLYNFFFINYFLRKNVLKILGEINPKHFYKNFNIDSDKIFSYADFGCGSGFWSNYLVKNNNCRIMYCIDKSEQKLNYTYDKSNKYKTSHKIELIENNISENINMKPDSVNIGLLNFVLCENPKSEHIKILKNIINLLNPEYNILIISDFIKSKLTEHLELENCLTLNDMEIIIDSLDNIEVIEHYNKGYIQTYIIKKCYE